MNDKEKKSINTVINRDINELIVKIKKLTEDTKPIPPENAIGRVSRMDAINNKSVLEASLINSKVRLKKLKIIKDKMNNKDFGLCIRCNKPIPIQRLIILPESIKCVNCSV